MDLVNRLLLEAGDTVIVEESNYGGAFTKFRKLGVNMVAIPLDEHGMRMDALEAALDDLAAKGVKPKFIYAIITVHNPTGTILPLDRRHKMIELSKKHGVPIFEDECYSDIVWSNERPSCLARAGSTRDGHPLWHILENRRPGAARWLPDRRLVRAWSAGCDEGRCRVWSAGADDAGGILPGSFSMPMLNIAMQCWKASWMR